MLLRPALLVLALTASSLAWGEPLDAPERLARLSYVEGEVTFAGAREAATSTLPERPLAPGDRITTDSNARAELALGAATIRLDEQTEFTIVDLYPNAIRIEVASGSASVYLRDLFDDETFEIVTPNAEITLDAPGEYRVDIMSERASALTVRAGVAQIASAGGPVRVADGQRVRIEGRDAIARLETPRPADAFDDWMLEREVSLAEAEPPQYTPYEGEEYEELDRNGEWYDEPRYGRVWMPSYGYSSWSPYGSGYWQRAGFGWSWYDPAPWGFYTLHYGRWAYLRERNRWCWVPGPRNYPRHHPRNDWPDRPRHHPRDRDTPESGPRTASRRLNAADVDQLPRTVTPTTIPRRVDNDRRPPQARENPRDERPRGGTYARGGDREREPATPPADVQPRDGGATMRSSRRSVANGNAAPTMVPRMKGDTGRRDKP